MIWLLIPIVYMLIGMFKARRDYARMAYYREQNGELLPMRGHTKECCSHGWSSAIYKKQYCNCGYYTSRRGSVDPLLVSIFWPVYMVESFVKGGTYTPKEVTAKALHSEEWEKMIEKELGINQPLALDKKRRA